MRTVAGIDLGSTTTKAILLDEGGRIVGQGITNSRSNYEVACAVALTEARLSAALSHLSGKAPAWAGGRDAELTRAFTDAARLALYRRQLGGLREEIEKVLDLPDRVAHKAELEPAAHRILDELAEQAVELFRAGAPRRSDFFRDLAGEQFLSRAERLSADGGVSFERVVGLYDRAVLVVETKTSFYEPWSLLRESFALLPEVAPADLPLPTQEQWTGAAAEAAAQAAMPAAFVGTGYGRQTLPFDPAAVRSEILCHGRGAHHFFPGTRTVLDIGGQDTKAIQVDAQGVVTGFQMNDRCAAGCGRYLGYIADELGLGLHELGPLALQARRSVRVNSTCTVFAGAELRERLALGERREDILLGLHRAIVLRALSLLSRAGGVKDEFTFTGGVCKNPAVTTILREVVKENYGEIKLNMHPDSIYMGALGAALFALDDLRQERKLTQPRFASVADLAPPAASVVRATTPVLPAPVRKGLNVVASGGHAPPQETSSAAQVSLPGGRVTGGGKRSLTAGIDVGASAVKVAIVDSDGVTGKVLAMSVQRIRKRMVPEVARAAFAEACERAGVPAAALRYVASTGDGDAVPFRSGHFYSMTAHARGALYLVPEARGALDLGALHARAIRIDDHARVLGHRMTSQCASGTGQFIENVARYLGVPLEDAGALSLTANAPEAVSSVCAVLSETDVINLVSRGVSAADILQGINLAIAGRLARLVGSAKIDGTIALTGGLAADQGLVACLDSELRKGRKGPPIKLVAHAEAAAAGAIGAGILAALRTQQLEARGKQAAVLATA